MDYHGPLSQYLASTSVANYLEHTSVLNAIPRLVEFPPFSGFSHVESCQKETLSNDHWLVDWLGILCLGILGVWNWGCPLLRVIYQSIGLDDMGGISFYFKNNFKNLNSYIISSNKEFLQNLELI